MEKIGFKSAVKRGWIGMRTMTNDVTQLMIPEKDMKSIEWEISQVSILIFT